MGNQIEEYCPRSFDASEGVDKSETMLLQMKLV